MHTFHSIALALLAVTASTLPGQASALPDNANVIALAAPGDVKPEIANAVKSTDAFAKAAALNGMAEVEFGKLAATRAADKKVQEFAQRMIVDHGRTNSAIKGFAKTKGIVLPDHLDEKQQAVFDMLKNRKDADFDLAYAAEMAIAHESAVALFTAAVKSKGVDVIFQSFAEKTLPTLEEHSKLAMELHPNASKSASIVRER